MLGKLAAVLALAALCAGCSNAAMAQADGVEGKSVSSGPATAACYQTTSSGGNVDFSVPTNDWISLNGVACGAANTIGIGYQSGVSYIEIAGGNGLLLPGSEQLNIAGGVSGVAINLQTAGKEVCLSNGSDCFYDSSGIFTTTAGMTVTGALVSTVNITAANSVVGDTNACAGSSSNLCIQVNGTARDKLASIDQHIDINVAAGGGDMVLPKVANASLLTCTASTEDATHAPSGAVAYDTTNNGIAYCDGTSYRTHIYGVTGGFTGVMVSAAISAQNFGVFLPSTVQPGQKFGNTICQLDSATAGTGTAGTLIIKDQTAPSTVCTPFSGNFNCALTAGSDTGAVNCGGALTASHKYSYELSGCTTYPTGLNCTTEILTP